MSTSKRALKFKPQLARHYEAASKSIHQSKVYVPVAQWAKFYDREDELTEAGVFPRDYAYRLLEHTAYWIKRKGWRTMPVNMFLGDWALNEYTTKLGNRPFDYITDKEESKRMVEASQHLLMEYIKHYQLESEDAAISDLWLFMSEEWKLDYKKRARGV